MAARATRQVIKRTRMAEGPNGEDVIEGVLVEPDGHETIVKQELVSLEESAPEVEEDVIKEQETAPIAKRSKRLMSAMEMAALAEQRKEEDVRSQKNLLLNEIFDGCMEKLLEGFYAHVFEKETGWSQATIKVVIAELKSQGYKTKKVPAPGNGFTLEIRWPTKSKKKEKKSGKTTQQVSPKRAKKVKAEKTPQEIAAPQETPLSPEELEEARLRDEEFRRKGRERLKKARAVDSLE